HYIPATGSSMRVTPKALSDLGWPELLAELAARTHTQRGAQAARALAFASSSDEVGERSNEIAEVRRLRAEGPGLPWGGSGDVREALERVAKGGALESEDLRAVATTLRSGAVLRRFLLAHHDLSPRLAARIEPLSELPDVSGPIDDAFEPTGRL